MTRNTAITVITGIGLGAAAAIAYLATRTAGPVQLTRYTECRQGTIQPHLVTEADLLTAPARTRHHYPVRVAPALVGVIANGFAPLYAPPDPQIAALPAEEAW